MLHFRTTATKNIFLYYHLIITIFVSIIVKFNIILTIAFDAIISIVFLIHYLQH